MVRYIDFFRGSELQNFFTKILEDHLKAVIKPQYVDQIPKAVKGTVEEILTKRSEVDHLERIFDEYGSLINLLILFFLILWQFGRYVTYFQKKYPNFLYFSKISAIPFECAFIFNK